MFEYPSNLTNEESAIIGPLTPPTRRGGNTRTINEREVVNRVIYIRSTDCRWLAIHDTLYPL